MKKFSLFLFVGVLALAACSGDKKEPLKEIEPTKPEIRTDNLICPQVAILQEAQESFDYAGETPDPAQLVAKAKLAKIDGDCAYRAENKGKKKSGIDIAFTLHQIASRGPRLGGETASFPYFIAVVDPSENILSREVITAQFKFSGSDKLAELDEPLHVFIPVPPQGLMVGPDYRVLVGYTMGGNRVVKK